MQTVLTDSLYGVNARPLATSVTRGLGDVELGLKVNLFDSFHGGDSARFSPKRLQVAAVHRRHLPARHRAPCRRRRTSRPIATGDHQRSVQVRCFTDLLFGAHFWISLVGSYTSQMADQLMLRIPDSPNAGHPRVVPAGDRAAARRATIVDLQVNPRWLLNDYLSIAGQYYYRHKSADAYSGTFQVTDLAGNTATLDAAVLGMYTEASESRMGIGATYSTVVNVAKHKSGVPFDISYFHYETTLGSLGRVPKISVDQVTMRVYQRLFGR